MSRDAGGNYTLPPLINPVKPGEVISTSWANPTLADIATALTDSLSRSGKGGMATDLVMNGYRVTSLGLATQALDAAAAKQVRDQSFSWLSPVFSDSTGNNYTGTAPLAVALANGTAFQFLADKDNTGAMTLGVNGAAPAAILVNGAPIPVGLVKAGTVVEVTYVGGTYRVVTVSSSSGTVNSVQSSDAQVLSVDNNVATNIATIIPHTNVANGLVKLDGSAKVPVAQLPFTDLHYVGIWNAAPGTLPATAGINNGDFYVVTVAGNLPLFRTSGGNVYTSQATPVIVGDALILRAGSTDPNQPNGWYYDPGAAGIAVASTVTMNATSANAPFAGITNLQTWLNAADPAILARMPLAGGNFTGPVTTSIAPGTPQALTNKLYVDTRFNTLQYVASFNTRVGAVTLTSADVTGALGYTPFPNTGGTISGNLSVTENINATKGVGGLYFAPTFWANDAATGNLVADFFNSQSQRFGLIAPVNFTSIANLPQGSMLRLMLYGTNYAITWPADVVWPLGVTPSLGAGPQKFAAVVLVRLTGGTILGSATMY